MNRVLQECLGCVFVLVDSIHVIVIKSEDYY